MLTTIPATSDSVSPPATSTKTNTQQSRPATPSPARPVPNSPSFMTPTETPTSLTTIMIFQTKATALTTTLMTQTTIITTTTAPAAVLILIKPKVSHPGPNPRKQQPQPPPSLPASRKPPSAPGAARKCADTMTRTTTTLSPHRQSLPVPLPKAEAAKAVAQQRPAKHWQKRRPVPPPKAAGKPRRDLVRALPTTAAHPYARGARLTPPSPCPTTTTTTMGWKVLARSRRSTLAWIRTTSHVHSQDCVRLPPHQVTSQLRVLLPQHWSLELLQVWFLPLQAQQQL